MPDGSSYSPESIRPSHPAPEDILRKQGMRTMSKSTPEGKIDRQVTAQNLRQIRTVERDHAEMVKQATEQRSKIGHFIEEKEQQPSSMAQELEKLSQELQRREASLSLRVLDMFKPGKKEELVEQIHSVQSIKEQIEREINDSSERYSHLTNELKTLMNQKKALKDKKDILKEFYAAWGKKYDQEVRKNKLDRYIEEHGSVADVVERYHIYLVHATNPYINKGHNNNVTYGLMSWEDKIGFQTEFSPTVCASSIQEKNGVRKLWADIGVIYNGQGGRVEGAGSGDGRSTAVGLKKRVNGSPPLDAQDYEQQLSHAIARPSYDGLSYNEIVIGGDPHIAGIFVNLDSLNFSSTGLSIDSRKVLVRRNGHLEETHEIKFSDIFETAGRFGMSVFAFDQGVAYAVGLDKNTGKLLKQEKVSPKEMLTRTYTIPEENRAEITARAKANLRPEVLV